jgi:protein arginine kinase activator
MQQHFNGTKTEYHLCQECSAQVVEAPISIEALIHGLLGSFLAMAAEKADSFDAPHSDETCPVCGMTFDDFKSGGKLGCEACYRTFERELEAILKNVQGSVRHEGKFPQKSGVNLFQKREAVRLRDELRKAVEEENFESAAYLRDQIRAIERNLESLG